MPVDRIAANNEDSDDCALWARRRVFTAGDYVIPAAAYRWGYKREPHGTRQFRKLMTVTYEGDEFAVVAHDPCSSIFQSNECMVKFSNRVLYMHDCWELIDHFLNDHKLRVNNVSRCDICCDFNHFEQYKCIPFIADFLASKLRHIGRGNGSAHFNHFAKREGVQSVSKLVYTGLSFGGHESDAHIYLYNKSYEMETVKQKPYIRDLWVKSGLDVTKDVWRLEVSLKSKAMKFRDRKSKEDVEVTAESLHDVPEIIKIYHTFTGKMFRFVKNDHIITNISREPVIDLFGADPPSYDRAVLRPITGSNRTEKILIKQLHQMGDKYRNPYIKDLGDEPQMLAETLAQSCDLAHWYHVKQVQWEKPIHK